MLIVSWVGIGLFLAGVVALAVLAARRKLSGRASVALGVAIFAALALGLGTRHSYDQATMVVWEPDPAKAPPAWGHVPLGVYWDGVDFPEHVGVFREAVERFNDEVGCLLFVPATRETADIRIVGADGTPCNVLNPNDALAILDEHTAAARFVCVAEGRVEIQIRQLDAFSVAEVIIRHELGHALGLAHWRWGLMTPTPSESMWFGATDLTDRQRAEVRARFCSRGAR